MGVSLSGWLGQAESAWIVQDNLQSIMCPSIDVYGFALPIASFHKSRISISGSVMYVSVSRGC